MQQPLDQVSKLILAVLFAGLALALVQGGWTGSGGALDWFKAKFLGQPAGTTPPANWSSLPIGSFAQAQALAAASTLPITGTTSPITATPPSGTTLTAPPPAGSKSAFNNLFNRYFNAEFDVLKLYGSASSPGFPPAPSSNNPGALAGYNAYVKAHP